MGHLHETKSMNEAKRQGKVDPREATYIAVALRRSKVTLGNANDENVQCKKSPANNPGMVDGEHVRAYFQ